MPKKIMSRQLVAKTIFCCAAKRKKNSTLNKSIAPPPLKLNGCYLSDILHVVSVALIVINTNGVEIPNHPMVCNLNFCIVS